MAIYLRKASRGSWHPRREYNCGEGDIPLDPLTDLRTKDNRLSVWKIEDIEEDSEAGNSNLIRRIVAALAANLNGLGDIHYILISDRVLTDLAIDVEKSRGQTPDKEANAKWHYDLYIHSAESLLGLTDALLGKPRLALKDEVKTYLQEGLDSKWLEKLNRRISIDLGIIQPGDCSNCGEPVGNCPNCGKPVKF